jgi:hypothetical protein
MHNLNQFFGLDVFMGMSVKLHVWPTYRFITE